MSKKSIALFSAIWGVWILASCVEASLIPLTDITYRNSPIIATANIEMTTAGGALPAGLSLSTAGIISGTPSAIAAQTTYTITAVGSGDYLGRTTTATINITVNRASLQAADVTLTGATSVSATARTAVTTGLPSLTLANGATATFSIAPTDATKNVGGVSINTAGVLTINTNLLGEAEYTITASGTGNYTGTVTVPSTITVTSKYVLGTGNIPAIDAASMIDISANPLPKVGGGNLNGAHGLAGSTAEVYTVNTANNAFTFTEALLINGYKTDTFPDTVTISGGRVAIGAIGQVGASGMTIALNQNRIIQDPTQSYTVTAFGIQVKNTTDGNNGFAVSTSTGALAGTTWKSSNLGFTGGTNETPEDRTSAAFTIENGRALVLGLAASGATQISFTSIEILPVPTPVVIRVTISDGTETISAVEASVGDSITLTADVQVENGAAQTVTWLSSDTAVAIVSAAGEVLIAGVGTATITATSNADPNQSAAVSISAKLADEDFFGYVSKSGSIYEWGRSASAA